MTCTTAPPTTGAGPFAQVPTPLTLGERHLALLTTIIVGLTRIWACSRTLWDWDEALFCMALDDFDVPLHHPHPPGFPSFIFLARLIHVVVPDRFRAVQSVTVIASLSLFPLILLLGRELRFSFRTAYLGALLFVFFPNVWFFGGTAFSDVPGLTLTLCALILLLQGCRDPRRYIAGAVMLGLAAAVRPQALVIGAAAALLASWTHLRRGRSRAVALAIVAGGVAVTGAYAGAALASSSVDSYFDAMRNLSTYVRTTDSFLNPARPPLHDLLDEFFLKAVPGGKATAIVGLLALVGLASSVRPRHPGAWILAASFMPLTVLAWFMLDLNSVSRYGIGYAPMYAIFAAHGAGVLANILRRYAGGAQVTIVLVLVTRYAYWILPGLIHVRSTDSPPVAAMAFLQARSGSTLYVHGSVAPFVTLLLPDRTAYRVDDGKNFPFLRIDDGYYVAEGRSIAAGTTFRRSPDRLGDIARQRYFAVCVVPVATMAAFGDGWYQEEEDDKLTWRWMTRRGVMWFAAAPQDQETVLTLKFGVPRQLVAQRPTISVYLNGVRVEEVRMTARVTQRTWVVRGHAREPNLLVLETDRTINLLRHGISADARDLGVQLLSYEWRPVPARAFPVR